MKNALNIIAILLRKSELILKPKIAYAHCDIPCGIYETDSMAHAAETVYKMVEKIQELKHPPEGDHQKHIEYENTMSRMVHVKEEHAQKCKQEILILWTDYFKDEHLAKFPDLHTKIWKATKLCSQVKRNVDLKLAQQLKDAVAEIAKIFAETKK